jgi:hypothetical protein
MRVNVRKGRELPSLENFEFSKVREKRKTRWALHIEQADVKNWLEDPWKGFPVSRKPIP